MRRFSSILFLVAAVCVALAGRPFTSPAAAPAGASDGVKVGQRLEVQYVVGTKTVYASATLGADGTLSFAFPTEDGLRVGWAHYRLVRQDSGPEPQPEPKPQPKPDPPTPTPGKLHVVVCYDADQLDNRPGPEAGVLTSGDVRAYLDAHCARIKVKLPDGKEADTAAYRFLSRTADPANLPPVLRDWFTEAKQRKIPTVTIYNGKDTYRGDLPGNAAAMLALLKQFGGP